MAEVVAESGLSRVPVGVHFDQHISELNKKLSAAEHAFVLCNFAKALELTNEILDESSISKTHGSSFEGKLRIPGPSHDWNISLMADPLDLIDRAAGLSLQAYYEFRPNINHLAPFMECYEEKRHMPLAIALLWVQFCFAIKLNTSHSVNMAAAILSNTIDQHWIDAELIQDLSWTLLIKMLPHSTDPCYVTELLEKVLSNNEDWLYLSSEYSYQDIINHESLNEILSRLEIFCSRQRLSSEFQATLRQQLSTLRGIKSASEVTLEKNYLPTQLYPPQLTLSSLPQRLAEKFLQYLRRNLQRPNWQVRSQLAMAILSIYLVWKRRRRLLKTGSAVASVAFSPLREVIDAILPEKVKLTFGNSPSSNRQP